MRLSAPFLIVALFALPSCLAETLEPLTDPQPEVVDAPASIQFDGVRLHDVPYMSREKVLRLRAGEWASMDLEFRNVGDEAVSNPQLTVTAPGCLMASGSYGGLGVMDVGDRARRLTTLKPELGACPMNPVRVDIKVTTHDLATGAETCMLDHFEVLVVPR